MSTDKPKKTSDSSLFGLSPTIAYPLVIFILVLATSLLTPRAVLSDPDTYWHIAIGKEILGSWTWPQSDVWSHTFAGERWIAKEWLGQIIFALFFSVGGWPLVVVLAGILVAATAALVTRFAMQKLSPVTALIILLPAAPLLVQQTLARPLVLFVFILAAWMIALVQAVADRKSPPLALWGLMLIWANVHGSFMLGIAIAAVLALEAISKAPFLDRLKTLRNWALFGTGCVVAGALTPYGIEPYLVALSLSTEQETRQYILEWRKPDLFGAQLHMGIAISLGVLVGVFLTILRGMNPFRLVLVLLCAYMAYSHLRFGTLYAIVATILIVDSVQATFARLRANECATSAIGRRAMVAWAIGSCLAISPALAWRDIAPVAKHTPSEAFSVARSEGLSGPVYNDYNFGGFLIFNGVPTFIDGRSDQLFINGFMSRLYEILDSGDRQGFVDLLAEHRITWTLVRPDSKAARLLDESDDWILFHEDEVASIYRPYGD